MDTAALLFAALMGAVEGLTEFLPLSSTGHLILLGEAIGFRGPPGQMFQISIQLGAVSAVAWLSRDVLWRLATRGWVPGTPARRYASNVLLAFLPALVLGATLYGPVTRWLFTPSVVAVALIVGGLVIIAVERRRPAARIASVLALDRRAAVLIGLGQVVAMVPGTSRSAATIIVALLAGMQRRAAIEFSLMLAIPTIPAAVVYSLWRGRAALDEAELG